MRLLELLKLRDRRLCWLLCTETAEYVKGGTGLVLLGCCRDGGTVQAETAKDINWRYCLWLSLLLCLYVVLTLYRLGWDWLYTKSTKRLRLRLLRSNAQVSKHTVLGRLLILLLLHEAKARCSYRLLHLNWLWLVRLAWDTWENVEKRIIHCLRWLRLLGLRLNWNRRLTLRCGRWLVYDWSWYSFRCELGFFSSSSLFLCFLIWVFWVWAIRVVWIGIWFCLNCLLTLFLLFYLRLLLGTRLSRHVGLLRWCALAFSVWIVRLVELPFFVIPKSVYVFASEARIFAACWRGRHALLLKLRWIGRTACVLNALHFISGLPCEFSLILKHSRVL